MLNRLSNKAMVKVVAIVGVMLAILLLSSTLWAQGSEIPYEENAKVPVATFTAADEDEGQDAISWSLKESGDHMLFEIDEVDGNGVLSFENPPDFEDPKDVGGDFIGDNVYKVTVVANKGDFDVEVTVTDKEEEGVVTLTQPQPQVEIQFTADLDDDDGGVSSTTWQWARSMDGETDWTDIDGAKARSYTPVVDDIDHYLRATASYTDRRGDGKTAAEITEEPVEPETAANAAPVFPKEDSDEDDTELTGTVDLPFKRSVNENTKAGMAIGNPVVATDGDDDIVLHTLGGTDKDHFSIDERSGQIKVKGDLDYEDAENDDHEYTVTVTGTDPSLASATVTVTISVVDMNEAPTFTDDTSPTEWTVEENDATTLTASGDDVPGATTYSATDSDQLTPTTGGDVGDTVELTIEGPDKDKFTLSGTGGTGRELQFVTGDDAHTPDYETQKEYSITIVAADANTEAENRIPATKSLDVTVKVTNEEETGTVKLTQVQVQVGVSVIAELTDPDGGESRVRWQWYKQESNPGDPRTCDGAGEGTWEMIEGAKSAVYTPSDSHLDGNGDGTLDDPDCLRATAEYRDAIGEDDDDDTNGDQSLEMAHATSGTPVEAKTTANKAPKFTAEDENDDGTDEEGTAEAPFLRNVDENHKGAFGSGLGVDDDDSALIWRLTGGDTDSFSIGRTDGQLSTKMELDFEMKSEYMVEVTVTDPSLATGTAMVMITVNDKDDPGVIAKVDPDDYEENAKVPVATFTAADEDEGQDAISWSLKESGDHMLFEIDEVDGNGVLSFENPPDFEDPKDVGGDFIGDNVYKVTVVANKGDFDVEVTVTDKEEEGVVTLTQPQPQVEIQFTADLDDDDGGVSSTTWQWARSMDGETDWTDIDGAKARSYTPVVDDIDHYLRATASYTDRRGDGKTAAEITEEPVEPETAANAAPVFPKEDSDEDDTELTGTVDLPFKRSVNENTKAGMAIGNPVVATDGDDDIVLHTLGGTDKDHFSIDERSGQIKVKGDLDYEDAENDDHEYTVTVTGTDPSLASATVTVTISVVDMNEAPTFTDDTSPTEWTVEENDATTLTASGDDVPGATTYSATDSDQLTPTTGGDVGDTVELTIEGPDKDKFTLSGTGGTGRELQFVTGDDAHTPDYETQKEYSITIVAADANTEAENRIPATKSLDVTVKVTNEEETGTVKLTQVQVQVGVSVIAELTDPDGGESRVRWQWYKQESNPGDPRTCDGAGEGTWEMIEGAKSAVYTPSDSHLDGNGDGTLDDPDCLRATAEYRDAIGEDDDDDTNGDQSLEMAHATSGTPVEAKTTANKAPKFTAEDENDDGTDEEGTAEAPFLRNVDENHKGAFGSGLGVDDDDSALIWRLTGGDTDSFSIGRTDGQLSTKMELDFEMKSEYMVEVTVTDPSLATGTAMVMITVNDKDDDATIELNSAPAFDADTAERSVEENAAAGDAVGDPVEATDPNTGDTLTYTLGGDDAGSFTIDEGTGQIMVGEGTILDFEPGATEFSVMVTATDRAGASDSVTVTISVTDVNEAPAFDASMAEIMVAENTAAGEALGDPIAAMDVDADDTLTYTLSGDDAESFAIDGATGQLTTMAALDYETKNSYTVTVTATDSADANDSVTVTISVTDMNEAPAFDADMAERSVAENTAAGEALGDPIAATDVDADDTLTYTLGGDDAESFAIDGETGQLTTMAALDYETTNSYTVMVTATDSGGESDSIMVTISVTDVNEAPVVMGDAEVSYEEGGMDAVGTYTVDPAEATLSLGGDDADAFTLTDGVLSFNEAPDYEMPGDADGDNVYMVTITGTMDDQMGEQAIAITVTNKDEMGSISFDSEEPRAGTAIIASLMDYDGIVDGSVTWQWSIESEPGTYEDIEGATDASYTPVAGDEEKHLRVTAMYDDGEGMGKMAVATVINLVSAEVDYDADGNGMISRDEAVTAVQDYFANVITREQVLGVIMDYFAGVGQ